MDTLKIGQVVKLRNRLWRVDNFDEHELVASPIDTDAQQKTSFLIPKVVDTSNGPPVQLYSG